MVHGSYVSTFINRCKKKLFFSVFLCHVKNIIVRNIMEISIFIIILNTQMEKEKC